MINQTYAAPRDKEIYRGTDHDKPMMMMMYRWFIDEAFAKQPHKPHRINPIIIVLFADQVESISQTIDRPTLFMVSVHILISLCSESVKFYTVIYYTYISIFLITIVPKVFKTKQKKNKKSIHFYTYLFKLYLKKKSVKIFLQVFCCLSIKAL